MQVLLVGAHAADMEFTAGHVARVYSKAGHKVTFLHLTAGEKGHPHLGARTYLEQKRKEAAMAAQALAADVRILDYGDGELAVTDEVAWEVADTIRELRPDLLITHWQGSGHTDHRNCHFIARRALFLAGLSAFERERPSWRVPDVFYPENYEDMEGFVPDISLDVTAVYHDWLEAARAYELFRGGVSEFRYQDYYEALAQLRGCLGGVPKAAALMGRPGRITRVSGGLPLHG